MTTDQQTDGPVAGWYPDPLEQADLRWFDGSAWTEQTRAHPSSDEQATDASAPAAGTADTDDDPSDADLLALLAAEQRRRRLIIGGVLLVLVVAAIAWFVLGGGEDDSGSQDSTSTSSEPVNVEPGVQGRVEGEPVQPTDDTQSLLEAAAKAAAVQSIDSVVRAMESCSVRNDDGSYTGCDAAALLEVSPSLRPVLDACGSPGGGCVKLIGTDGYEVRVQDTFDPPRTWIEIHAAGDSITRTCEPAGCTDTGTWEPDET